MFFGPRRFGLVIAISSLFGFLSSAPAAQAQVVTQGQNQSKPSVTSEAQPKSQPLPDAKVPLLDHPLTLRDFPDMAPSPALNDKLGHLAQFIQNTPTDGAPATEPTEVYTGAAQAPPSYFVFLCFDQHPELIRTHLARRENILKDDYVTVNLDPFQDRQRGVEFQVNPNGVQADASWNRGQRPRLQLRPGLGLRRSHHPQRLDGPSCAIPFRSLRFPPHSSDWGVVLSRNIPRNSETDNWPRISANVSGELSQEGTLHLGALAGVTGSHNIQLTPYALGQNEHTP